MYVEIKACTLEDDLSRGKEFFTVLDKMEHLFQSFLPTLQGQMSDIKIKGTGSIAN